MGRQKRLAFLRWGSLANRPKENDTTKANKVAPSDADIAFEANRVLSAIKRMNNQRTITGENSKKESMRRTNSSRPR